MKYTEFGRKLGLLGFQLDEDDKIIIVSKRDGTDVASVSITEEFAVDFVFNGFYSLRRDQKKDLVDLCYLLASTPLDEREDEKQYYVKFMKEVYLAYYPKSRNRGVVRTREGVQGKTQFTEQQIKNLDSRYWSFAEEVKEDE